jgi:hypothetical protein
MGLQKRCLFRSGVQISLGPLHLPVFPQCSYFGTAAVQSNLAALIGAARQFGVEATRYFDAQRRGELVIVRSAASVSLVTRP